MSKPDTLRGFIAERLAAAAREILAAVDRTVSGYEEEASGCRQEMERQRRQLEALLPRVKLHREGVDTQNHADEEGGDGEDEQTALSLHRCQKNPKDSSRQTSPRVQSERGNADKHLDLRVCMLQDAQSDILPKNVFQKCPVQRLKCPGGLQGAADLLDLLRSSFPQLAGGSSFGCFDIFTLDKTRRLRKVEPQTSEEICKYARSTRGKYPTLYIRLKTGDTTELLPLQRKDDARDAPSTSAELTDDEIRPQSSLAQQADDRRAVDILDVLDKTSQLHGEMESEQTYDVEDDRTLEQMSIQAISAGRSEAQTEGCISSDNEGKPEARSAKMTTKRRARVYSLEVKRTKFSAKTENSAELLACRVCGYLHKSNIMLIKHAWSHDSDPQSLCGVCGEHLESAEALKNHLQGHQKTHDCHVCGKSLLSIVSLTEHVAAHTGETPYECRTCHKRFALKLSLKNHQRRHAASRPQKSYTSHHLFDKKLEARRRSHGDEKPYRCGICGKSLCDLRSLNRHKLTHTGERRHSCHVCGKGFKLLGTLKTHEKIHTERDRTYLCDVCCKMFLTSKQLQIHMRTHTKEKPFNCGECGKGFSTKGTLTIHMRVHTGEMPYRCSECGWSFKRKTHLDNHLKVHSGQKPYVCLVCGKACARKFYLTVHMRTHNGERPYQCSICNKAFTQGHSLKTHMKSHKGAETVT
ncbi:uncharacterized protein LOC143010734 isoform X2 [Genypterus blacodes]|uniref:uncharacterized protein LOC143010734 isoform X2 n=1 Tax=Genypterus blacodes TaxID=154954 RepID=UPI003F774BF3